MERYDGFGKGGAYDDKALEASVNEFQKLFGMELKDIWNIDDRNSFLTAMNAWLSEKCEYGDNMSVLTPEERTVYVVNAFREEVDNGGFEQYLYNSSGMLAGELISALRAVGYDHVEGYAKALERLPAELPADDEERERLLDDMLDEEIEKGLDLELQDCDMLFYEHEDELDELLYRFINDNRNGFV